MDKTGLILEGGGLRCVFTAGVLDYFMEKGLYVPSVYGVSGGAMQGFSYISKQIGRSKRVNIDYVGDKRYLSFDNMIKHGGFFGFDFMFNDIARELLPFDFHTFEKSEQELVIGATNCITGKADYFYKSRISMDELFKASIASGSMPLMSKKVEIDGRLYLDGGIADSIPIVKSINDGNNKNIVILTRNRDYRKKKLGMGLNAAKIKYRSFPKLIKAIENRYKVYNGTLEYIDVLEKTGDVFVINPIYPVRVKRTEKDKTVLEAFYAEGYNTAKIKYDKLIKWLSK